MGFADRSGGRFFTIMGGKCVVKVDENTPGAVSRVNKRGNTVHEITHDSFEGKLVNIRTRDTEFGKQWEFDFRDDISQASGWLILFGAQEYGIHEPNGEGFSGWKVGSIEPTTEQHGNIEYLYIINLDTKTLTYDGIYD